MLMLPQLTAAYHLLTLIPLPNSLLVPSLLLPITLQTMAIIVGFYFSHRINFQLHTQKAPSPKL